MEFFNQLKNIFSSNCCDEGKSISKEQLTRSDDYCIQYGKWQKLNKHQAMLDMIYEAATKRMGCPTKKDKSICFLMIPTINGFTMHYDGKRWAEEDFRYLFEYISIVLIQNYGYNKSSSTKEKIEYKNRMETVERYQLKTTDPEKDYSEILIRLCCTNNKITSLKFCATCAKHRITNFQHFLKEMAAQ